MVKNKKFRIRSLVAMAEFMINNSHVIEQNLYDEKTENMTIRQFCRELACYIEGMLDWDPELQKQIEYLESDEANEIP